MGSRAFGLGIGVTALSLGLSTAALLRADERSVRGGSVVVDRVEAPSLAGNLLGDAAQRQVAVYLPPSYAAASDRRYPVVYFLGGFGDTIDFYLTGRYQGFTLPMTVDQMFQAGDDREMIVVVVSGYNRFRGSFYVNSPVTGDWETHVVKEIVGHVDAHYRTVARVESRGIAGHSMGGFGALHLAMRHPTVFGWCYALSPGLLAPDGLADLLPFENGGRVTEFLAAGDAWRGLSPDQARQAAKVWADRSLAANDWPAIFALAYGTAFAPSAGATALGLEYPYSNETDGLHLDANCWWRWEAGFGDVAGKVRRHRAQLAALRGLVIEYGRNDENGWIPRGCEAFASALKAAGVAHTLMAFDGGHEDQLGARLERHALPYFAKHLVP